MGSDLQHIKVLLLLDFVLRAVSGHSIPIPSSSVKEMGGSAKDPAQHLEHALCHLPKITELALLLPSIMPSLALWASLERATYSS